MLSFEEIVPGPDNRKVDPPVPIENCFSEIRTRFRSAFGNPIDDKDLGNLLIEQSNLVIESVKQLSRYNNRLAKRKFCKQLSREFNIPMSDFDEAEKQIIEDSSRQALSHSSSSKTARVEEWISENYELYYNEVSHRYIGRRASEPELYEIKIENIYRDLDLAHLKYQYSDLKILLRTDFIRKLNPFQAYFENLPKWDGIDWIEKLGSFLRIGHVSDLIDEELRFKTQFKKMFVRSVACSLEQDFNKQCFTLVDEKQNSGKSTLLRWLCPPELKDYYSENIGMTKDDHIALAENFIINIDELDVMGKFDINSLKSYLSKDVFKERLPYGERTELLKRRCNFVASTNRHEFLADETGSVRWICFLLEKIDWRYRDCIDINNVWAQAYHLFSNTGFNYQLTFQELRENELANRQFFVRTNEMDLIYKYYRQATSEEISMYGKLNGKNSHVRFMSATEIKEDILLRTKLNERLSNVNIGKAFKFYGFEQKSERFSGEDSRKGYWLVENQEEKLWGKTYF